jgi:hypothetical protein
MRKLSGLHLPKTSRASRQRSRRQTHIVRMLLEQMEERVMLSAAIVSVPGGATPGAAPTTAWMGQLADSTPLTDISLPGTYESASGPSLQDTLSGSGSENQVSGTTPTTIAVLTTHIAAGTASAAAATATLAGKPSPALNAAATTANVAATAADAAAGINQTSTGALLAIGLASDIQTLAVDINTNVQDALGSAAATSDTTANAANSAAGTADTTVVPAATAAGTADAAEGAAAASAGIADTTVVSADTTAGAGDLTAGSADTGAATADGLATGADVIAGAQGGIDPVTDGTAAGVDLAGVAVAATAVAADTSADVTNTAAVVANDQGAVADGVAIAAEPAAVAANEAVTAPIATAATANGTAATAATTAATAHLAAAAADEFSAGAWVAAATASALTAQQYSSFVTATSADTSGNNPMDVSAENKVVGLAEGAAGAYVAAVTAESLAAVADANALAANTIAAFANASAATAVNAATMANAEAATADEAATAADEAEATADGAAATADAAAEAADAAATTANSAAEALDAAAGVTNGVAGAANTAAAAGDTTAIALEATALATAAIPFADVATAAAAGVAAGLAAGLDTASVAGDTADVIADGLAIAADGTAAALDATATAADAAAAAANATAAAADAAAAADDAAATTADTSAASADAAATTACARANVANQAADHAEAAAKNANLLATAACLAATGANIAFLEEVQTNQDTQTSLQTQTMDITDQLHAGIRSLDLPGALVDDTININAGSYFTGVTLQDALNNMTSFLEAHPSETIVVTLSAGVAAPINSVNSFVTDLNTLLDSPDTAVPGTTYNDFLYESSNPDTTPDLDHVRGKIVIIPSGFTPLADSATKKDIGWQPSEVIQDSPAGSDPNTQWNYAENDNGANDNGLIPTDLGNPDTLYVNDLTPENPATASPVALGDAVDAIAQQYFGSVAVTRTADIVGMDDPGQTLIDDIINENNLPIIVTSGSDGSVATGTTLRAAITQADSQSGVNTIEIADDLSGTTGNTISLQSDLPEITNDVVIAGSALINANGHQGLQAAPTHDVTETDYVAGDSGLTKTTSKDSTPVYLDTSGFTDVAADTVTVDPVDITYGTALANSQLHGIATNSSDDSIAGTFKYTSGAGTVPGAGNGQIVDVTFTPTDTSLSPTSTNVTVNVAKATLALSNVSPNPFNITYGTALDNTQLSGNATNASGASIPGTFTYTSGAGSVLTVGSGQSESITFIPNDTTDYTSASSTVTVNVAQAMPVVTVNPLNISFGTPLDNTQLGGTATFAVAGNTVSVPGTYTYTKAGVPGTVLTGGNGQSEAVTFTPADTTDYMTVSTSVTINVSSQAKPTVEVNPVNITYGTALRDTQLTGTAIFALDGNIVTVPGVFFFTTALGSVPGVGNEQSEDVYFLPQDTATYMITSSSVIVNVAPATPTVESIPPYTIYYGDAITNAQLRIYAINSSQDGDAASFNYNGVLTGVDGTVAYTSAAGLVLPAGNGYTEAFSFAPANTKEFNPASSTVNVNVRQAPPTVESINPVTVIYGTALANSQLSGTATWTVDGNLVAVPGTFTYASAAGKLLHIGNGQTVAVTFTPTDTTDYTKVSTSVNVNVLPIPPTVTVADAGGTYKGSSYPATGTVTGAGSVNLVTVTPPNPKFYYYLATDKTFASPSTVAPSDAGNYVAVCVYAATGDYGVGAALIDFTISPAATATAITSSASPAVYGQPITCTAMVTNTSGVPPTPGGTPPVPAGAVQFVVDGVNSGSPVSLNSSGQAVSSPISFLTGASHSVQAVYMPGLNSIGNTNFVGSKKSLTQGVQSSAIEPDPVNPALTDLFMGSAGAISSDQVQVSAVGSSSTGSTGVKVQTSFNGVNTQTTYSQSFNAIYVYLQNGNDNVQLASTLTLSAVVTAGNGNDNIQLGQGNNVVTVGDGNDNMQAGSGNNTVTAGNGNDQVQLGNPPPPPPGNPAPVSTNIITLGDGNDTVHDGTSNNDTVTLGNGNDSVQLGNGDNVIVEGNGNDNVQAGNGGNLIVGGLGQHTIQVGNGNDILIDGSVKLTRPGDSLRQILLDWKTNPATAVNQRITVTYNTSHPSTLTAGSGRDWFFYTYPKTTSNRKPTDQLNSP